MIAYPFHPFHGIKLQVLKNSSEDTVTVLDPKGFRRKIPKWMIKPEAENYKVSSQKIVDANSLLLLSSLLKEESENIEKN